MDIILNNPSPTRGEILPSSSTSSAPYCSGEASALPTVGKLCCTRCQAWCASCPVGKLQDLATDHAYMYTSAHPCNNSNHQASSRSSTGSPASSLYVPKRRKIIATGIKRKAPPDDDDDDHVPDSLPNPPPNLGENDGLHPWALPVRGTSWNSNGLVKTDCNNKYMKAEAILKFLKKTMTFTVGKRLIPLEIERTPTNNGLGPGMSIAFGAIGTAEKLEWPSSLIRNSERNSR